MPEAVGSFEVALTPADPDAAPDTPITRLAITKRYSGDLTAAGSGQMLATRTPVEGSAGYVAAEHITGSLHGRRGDFVVQHHGILDRDAQALTITVVPDSGTDDLVGLTGKMSIRISDGDHFYEFTYQLP